MGTLLFLVDKRSSRKNLSLAIVVVLALPTLITSRWRAANDELRVCRDAINYETLPDVALQQPFTRHKAASFVSSLLLT